MLLELRRTPVYLWKKAKSRTFCIGTSYKSLNNFSPPDYFLKTYINNSYQAKMLWYSTLNFFSILYN